jgi:AcrR family transcriptional regulator
MAVQPARSRDSALTRAAILDSARKAFVQSGYDGAGVREIAAGAGVTAMLVNRYFGSKEALFAEVVATLMGGPRILTDELMRAPDAGRRLAEGVVAMTDGGATPLDAFLIMMRSAASPRAAEIAREQIERHHQKTVAEGLGGPLAPERAALILSLVSGFQTMRQGIGLSALTAADPRSLVDLLAPIFQGLIDRTSTDE